MSEYCGRLDRPNAVRPLVREGAWWKRELLSITEENAILVTVQFVDAGFRTKTNRAEVKSYDINLIVKNDIRCNQLIDAVQYGLEKS